MPEPKPNSVETLKALSQLTTKGVLEITDVVEEMHTNIGGFGGLLGDSYNRLLMGIPGLIYQNIRDVNHWVGAGINSSLTIVNEIVKAFNLTLPNDLPGNETLFALLNGVLGHYLHAENNPLAISMKLRRHGKKLDFEALEKITSTTKNGLLIMVHGSCMNDLQWNRKGHDHGQRLAKAMNMELVYLNYNSGKHISENGQEFSQLLEDLCANLPKDLPLFIIGHSMGGLVSRSACWFAEKNGDQWRNRLKKLIFLGTPHMGAPLERWGNIVETLFKSNPFSSPLAKLAAVRSHGVTDLRYGNILHSDWENQERLSYGTAQRQPTPLPNNVNCYAIAATTQAESLQPLKNRGDGLVPIASALGEHKEVSFNLNIPKENRWIGYGVSHIDLLSNQAVYNKLAQWMTLSS